MSPKITIVGSTGKLGTLLLNFAKKNNIEIYAHTCFKNIRIIDWGKIPNFDVIINATSLGLNNDDEIGFDTSKLGKDKFFYDVIYKPNETNFLKIGKKLGNKIENGKLIFAYQALASFKIWHKIQPEINNKVIKILD